MFVVTQIYMARDGIARFCTVPYQHPNNRNIHSAYMHLTNYSLNKRSTNYLHTESEVASYYRCSNSSSCSSSSSSSSIAVAAATAASTVAQSLYVQLH